ncbi:MAG: hypothetical protein JW932_13770 [Deltaproteobacteria bacterium]|nr:hypothetical protein [Deltaproteobacteria bacterium]
MAKIINFMERLEKESHNLITSKPWEFRRADWKTPYFIQMLKTQAIQYEKQRKAMGENNDLQSTAFTGYNMLKKGLAHTIQAIYLSRNNEESMRKIYYLAGLIDCMINQVNPLLRTDFIFDIYQKVTTLKKILNVHWYGDMDQVLFPLEGAFYDYGNYRETLKGAKTMKELYSRIREGTDRMFDVLSSNYTFYAPGRSPS